jgi:hypothetical protein
MFPCQTSPQPPSNLVIRPVLCKGEGLSALSKKEFDEMAQNFCLKPDGEILFFFDLLSENQNTNKEQVNAYCNG